MFEEFWENTFFESLKNQSFPKKNMCAIYADGDYHIDDMPKTDAI